MYTVIYYVIIIINVFTVTFDQFNASLLNISKKFLNMNLIWEKLTDPIFLNGSAYGAYISIYWLFYSFM